MRRLLCLLRTLWDTVRHPSRRWDALTDEQKLSRIARWRASAGWLLLVAALALPGCAHTQSVRHSSAVSLAATHAVLSAIDDVEAQIVCGVPNAPQSPMCIPASADKKISAYLVSAYELERRAALVMRSLPLGSPQPAEVAAMVVQISALVWAIVDLVPQSKAKTALLEYVGVRP